MKTRTQKFREITKKCIREICFYIRLAWPEMLFAPAAYAIGYFGSKILLLNDFIKKFVSNLLNTTNIADMNRFFAWVAVGMVILFYILFLVILSIRVSLEEKERSNE